MKHLLLAMLLSSALIPQARAESTLDLSYATSAGIHSLAFSGARYLGVALNDKLKVGLGLRMTNLWLPEGFELGDTQKLRLSSTSHSALNADFHLVLALGESLDIGMNLDLIGASFGGGSSGAEPRSFNLLLGGKNDRGTLNSEFYVGYRFLPTWIVRAGLSHQVVQYTSGGTHYQRFYNLAHLSACYLFN